MGINLQDIKRAYQKAKKTSRSKLKDIILDTRTGEYLFIWEENNRSTEQNSIRDKK